jgi:putative endonuclease
VHAEAYLRGLGMHIIAHNVSYPYGEIDIVAVDERVVVFVEVRSTEDDTTEGPAESVGPDKERKLTQAALAFLKSKSLLEYTSRFDLVLVSWPAGQSEAHIEHVPQAFEASGRGQMY